jgi:hypothetical protein
VTSPIQLLQHAPHAPHSFATDVAPPFAVFALTHRAHALPTRFHWSVVKLEVLHFCPPVCSDFVSEAVVDLTQQFVHLQSLQ